MAKITNFAIPKGTAYAVNGAAVNLEYGGQHGYWARLGMRDASGRTYDEWISNTSYVKRPIIPILLDYPKFFDLMPQPDVWKRSFKALMELHPISIEGLNSTINVDTDERAVGKAGEMQEEVTNTTRNRSTPTFNFVEKAGKPITNLFNTYIRYALMDPDTKAALIGTYIDNIEDIGGVYTAEMYSFSMLFIEPDPINKVVQEAWICTNMFPKTGPEITGSRTENGAGQLLDISVEFAAITMSTQSVKEMAQDTLKNLTILSKIPDKDQVVPSNGINPELKSINNGFDRVD